jgi:hypothetical protein
MNVITKETSALIAYAHEEVATAKGLLGTIAAARPGHEPDFRDSFGRRRHSLQLGVPSGETSRQLFDVSFEFAAYIIEAHIAKMEARIAELCQRARMELDGIVGAKP